MVRLKKKDVVKGLELEVGKEVLLLISPAGDEESYIEKEYIEDRYEVSQDIDTGEKTKTLIWGELVSNPAIYGSRRWLVEVQPKDNFSKPFTTHRNIEYLIGNYKVSSKNNEGIFRTKSRKLKIYREDLTSKDYREDKFLAINGKQVF